MDFQRLFAQLESFGGEGKAWAVVALALVGVSALLVVLVGRVAKWVLAHRAAVVWGLIGASSFTLTATVYAHEMELVSTFKVGWNRVHVGWFCLGLFVLAYCVGTEDRVLESKYRRHRVAALAYYMLGHALMAFGAYLNPHVEHAPTALKIVNFSLALFILGSAVAVLMRIEAANWEAYREERREEELREEARRAAEAESDSQ